MKIENREMLLYSINKAYEELCKVMEDKHVKEFESAEQEVKGTYPRRYPRHYGKKYLWKTLSDVPLKSAHEKQLYQEILCGNLIISTLLETRDMIISYYEKV